MKSIKGAKYVTYVLKDGRIFRPAYSFKNTKGVNISRADKFLIGKKVSSKGYLRVSIPGLGTRYVHRLIAEAFIPNPKNKPQINHKDGNKLNNASTNLEWVTNQENQTHALTTGLYLVNENSKSSILTDKQVYIIRELIAKKVPLKVIAKRFNVTPSAISAIKTGRTWKHLPSRPTNSGKRIFKP